MEHQFPGKCLAWNNFHFLYNKNFKKDTGENAEIRVKFTEWKMNNISELGHFQNVCELWRVKEANMETG